MGKQKRPRHKLHLAAQKAKKAPQESTSKNKDLPLNLPSSTANIFEGLKIDISSLSTKLPDDLQSVKSIKSVISEQGGKLAKKDKLKIRREIFLKKLDYINQQKNEIKKKNKKNKDLMGDTNSLKDALPSLESLLKSRGNVAYKAPQSKPRGIEKAKKRKKQLVQGVQVYKNLLKNSNLQKDPFGVISQHVRNVVQTDLANTSKKN